MSRLVSVVVNAILSPFGSAVRSRTGTPADTQTTCQTRIADTGVEAEQRTLILPAFPAEADAILGRATLDPNPCVVVDGRHFYLGTIGGKKVIVTMTGIGMVNATNTTETAFAYFTPESGISINAVVFAGVAGGSGRTDIGSVAAGTMDLRRRHNMAPGRPWHARDSQHAHRRPG